MDCKSVIAILKEKTGIEPFHAESKHQDELYLEVSTRDFGPACLCFHKSLCSAVMMFFAQDCRKEQKGFRLDCVFMSGRLGGWVFVHTNISEEDPGFDSLAKDIYSASLFERQIKEMFGIEPVGNPDHRRLNLHDEVWPRGQYPLRKDFVMNADLKAVGEYRFSRVEGEGVFEVPVGPVHAGIIGPGHFRFSSAGEPIINLEARLGFTHRGVEKLFEGRSALAEVRLSELVCGDSSFAHSLAFCMALEKVYACDIPERARLLRGIFLELERMYNHAHGISGIALDVGFSYPAAYASIIKEALLSLNEKLCANRYLKGINTCGGVLRDIASQEAGLLRNSLKMIGRDFVDLKRILDSNVSFMDRVDTTGVLKRKTAEDLGVVGLAARATGIPMDLRKDFPGIYSQVRFKVVTEEGGDVLSRLRVRMREFEGSILLIEQFLNKLIPGDLICSLPVKNSPGFGLGYAEAWRGQVLYWVKIDKDGLIQRCKIVDPSMHNWQGLCFAVLGDIIPDFPVCNKSFDLSYSGNDL